MHLSGNTPNLARWRSLRGFTLIEILIVITILVILFAVLAVAFQDVLFSTKERATKAALELLGGSQGVLSRPDTVNNLLKPERLASKVSKEFRQKNGIDAGKDYKSMSEMQRSHLLALLVAPTKDQWDTIVTDKQWQWKPAILEDNAKEFIASGSDGFNYVKDAWDGPITFEVKQSLGAGTTSIVIVRSAGPDQQWGTEDDLNYSDRDKHYTGPYDQKK